MSLTDTRTPTGPGPASLPMSAAAPARMPRRRRPGLLAAGAVITVVAILGGYSYARTAGDAVPVLAVANTVTAGHQITAADLKTVQVNRGSGLEPIPADQQSSVVGKYAAVELLGGTLLTGGQVADTTVPGTGKQLVGLELTPGQLPARALRPGEAVQLVITSDPRNVTVDAKGGDAAQALPRPLTLPATVAGVGERAADGNVVVDVEVAEAYGPGLLDRAQQGRVAIAVVAR
ncbi:flagellar protein FlgA [Actinoplanes cyaneus]|uniref:Flagellar protein FlgA n=1 Tax=Actinoplanes cyaneus TaxID=52696 RepID=A0A919MCV6_9ACTN|nr:SAF domain-containing protein [Actinoplanes cyaneus]MCW2144318.1 SAF domain-containing protein [Actinoplanes cyaneus]GID71074.1 flagellar protein FlgA [Actinoplanes cyaneus]